jgi:hypothetical protein
VDCPPYGVIAPAPAGLCVQCSAPGVNGLAVDGSQGPFLFPSASTFDCCSSYQLSYTVIIPLLVLRTVRINGDFGDPARSTPGKSTRAGQYSVCQHHGLWTFFSAELYECGRRFSDEHYMSEVDAFRVSTMSEVDAFRVSTMSEVDVFREIHMSNMSEVDVFRVENL